jgi:pimeloyl-ACP methyl ester carboxylesterase
MAKKTSKKPADYIAPLNMNGLHGRMLYMPPKNKKRRQILVVYGHHASLERMFGMVEELNRYGGVTLPDLPGFGGMESFYKRGEKPSLDNLADYLAAFVKLRYKRRRVTIIGMSFGFLVVTRMLQKYPELINKVDVLISLVGFSHYQDFKFNRRSYTLLRYGSSFFSNRLPAIFMRYVVLRKAVIRGAYRLVADKHSKLKDADEAERRRRVDFEIGLWHANDVRTYMDTMVTMLTVDLCNTRVDLPVYHIAVEDDRYFDNDMVGQHLNVIYKEARVVSSAMPGHAPTVIANANDAAPFIPKKIRRVLSRA